MKKNFIKVSVICALTLASSTAVVSCSDYDDDIKNHQEQIDALKKQLDASKTEITEGLNTAIEGLKAEITEIAGSKADAASVKALEQKAAELQQALDSKASNEQIAALSEEVKGLINDVNTELSAAMEETKTSLEGQISTLQQKQDELQKELATVTSSSNAANEKIADLEEQLKGVKSDLANAQSKHDALQNSVTDLENLLKSEIASLKEKQDELSKQIANCSSKEEVSNLQKELASVKEDLKTAQEQYKTLNSNVEALKTSLAEQIATLTSQLTTTSKNLNAAIQAQEEKVSALKEQLNEVNSNMLSINDRLQIIEEGKYGEKIVKLTEQIQTATDLITALETKTETEIKNLDSKLTAQITTTIENAKTEIDAKYGAKLEELDRKFENYVTVNQLNSEVETLKSLISTNTAAINGLIEGKVDKSEFEKAQDDINKIWAMVEENGTIDERIAKSISDLSAEIKGILGDMIQSVVFVPSYYQDYSIVPVGFSQLRVSKNGNTQEVAENITNTITLRVTPAYTAKDFANKYNVVFEGSETELQTRSTGEEGFLKVTKVISADENTGLVTLSVTKNSSIKAGKFYNLCAHITPKDEKSSDPTNISSNYFLAQHKIITVNNITVKSDATNKSFVWNKVDDEYSVAQNIRILGDNGLDLVKEFGDIFTVSYKMEKGNSSPFQVDPKSGVVKLKAAASDQIGVSDKVIATAWPTAYEYYSYETNLPTFTVIKEQKAYANSITLNWAEIATSSKTVNFPLNEIARQFGVSVDDAKSLINAAKNNAEKPGFTSIAISGDNLAVTIDKQANIQGNESIVIKMKDDAGSVTQSATEYSITIKINPLQYTSVALPEKQQQLWNGNTVIITPKVTKNSNGKITTISLGITDIKSIYTNIGTVATNAKNAGAYLQITTDKPTGINQAISYKSNGTAAIVAFTINKDTYAGNAINGTSKIVYTNDHAGLSENFQIKVLNISGTFTAPAAATNITMESKNGNKNVSGFKWVDYLENLMWENGAVSRDAFNSDPFAIYAMSKPTFEMNDKFLTVNANSGAISFTAAGKDYNFVQPYTATLKVKIPVSKWGAIKGLENAKIEGGNYVLTYNVVIPAGIQ